MLVKSKSSAEKRREELRKDFFPDEEFWTDSKEKGWFSATRTLSLVLGLMDSKALSGNRAPSKVYVELLTRHVDSGIIEMKSEEEHAYAAGYTGNRAVRSWRERMRLLKELGFIKTKEGGGRVFHYVLLVHPTVAVKQLFNKNKVSDAWWTTYRGRQGETGEPTLRSGRGRGRGQKREQGKLRKLIPGNWRLRSGRKLKARHQRRNKDTFFSAFDKGIANRLNIAIPFRNS